MNIPKFNPVENPVYLKVSERAAVQFTDHMTFKCSLQAKPRYRLCRHYRKSRTTFLMSMDAQRSLCWYSWILARPIETVLHGILPGGQWSVFTGLRRIWS